MPSWVYGGVPGKGAEDAIAPLLVKESQKWILASLDLTKAFDFADPTLVIKVLRHLGMATRTARLLQFAWTNQVRYLQLAGETLPAPSQVQSSLPQGDVFSMIGMTAVLIPIANLVQATHLCTV